MTERLLLLFGFVIVGVLSAGPEKSYAQAEDPAQGRSAGALERPLRFDRLTLEDGLAQGEIFGFLQDRRGFLWIATGGGLNRYDGHTFKVYAPIPFDTTSLSDTLLNGVYEDRAGAIWVPTHSGGLNRLDPLTETFTHFQHDPADPHSLSAGAVYAVMEDRRGALWVGTATGLSRMDPDRPGRFTRFQHDADDPGSLSSNSVRSIDEDAAGTLWIATANGLNRMEPDAPGRFERYLHSPGDADEPSTKGGHSLHHQYAPPGEPGVRWIGSDDGLLRFDAAEGRARRFYPNPDRRPGRNIVTTVSPDPEAPGVPAGTGQALWVPVQNHGLARFDPATETFTRYRPDPDNPHGLVEHAGSFVYTDRFGIVWVGSQGSGLNVFDPAAIGFAHYGAATARAPGLRNPLVWGLTVTRDGAIWAGTSEQYLHRIDRATGAVQVWQADPEAPPDPARPSGEANAFFENSDGTLWIGTTHGLDRYDPATETFTHYMPDPDDPASLCGDNVMALYRDRSGTLWVGTAGGLGRFDERTGAFTCYRHDPADAASLGNDWVAAVLEDRAGELWAATEGGVSRLDRATGRFFSYRHDPRDPATLTNGTFGWLHERTREPGVLWLASFGGGLDRLDTRTGAVAHYTAQTSELPDNTIYAILEDDAGRLWLSTNHGLARFDPDAPDSARAFRRFGLKSGLQSLEFNQHAAARDAEGRLYFGGVHGINTFHPEAVEGNTVPPLIALTDFKVSNERVPVGPDSPLRQALAETEAVRLAHHQRNVTVEFAALHFKNPARNRYRYRLDGFDADWIEAGTRRTASYTNLPPGDYTFRVTAANSDGVWNDEARTLRLTVLPPWWRTTTAYLLYGVLVLAGVFAVDRVQRRRLIRREREAAQGRELAQKREIEQAYHELRQTKDRLVQQEKLASLGQLTAGIAHEIKNPLNFVTNFAVLTRELADELAEDADPAEREAILNDLKTNARKIEEHGRRADSIVRSMMQHARTGSGERERVDLNAFVDEYVELAYHGKRATTPDFNAEIVRDYDAAVGEVEVVPQEIGRVVLNLVSNAFDAVCEKSAEAGPAYAPAVRVCTQKGEDSVVVRVEDNGPGMEAETTAKIFEPFFTTKPAGSGTGLGLSMSYDIVTQGHGGTLDVESKPGEGAAFVVRLPARKSHGKPSPSVAPAPKTAGKASS